MRRPFAHGWTDADAPRRNAAQRAGDSRGAPGSGARADRRRRLECPHRPRSRRHPISQRLHGFGRSPGAARGRRGRVLHRFPVSDPGRRRGGPGDRGQDCGRKPAQGLLRAPGRTRSLEGGVRARAADVPRLVGVVGARVPRPRSSRGMDRTAADDQVRPRDRRHPNGVRHRGRDLPEDARGSPPRDHRARARRQAGSRARRAGGRARVVRDDRGVR